MKSLHDRKNFCKYLLAVLLFGTNGIISSHIALSSYEIVFCRTLIASVFLLSVFVISRKGLPLPHNKKHLLFNLLSGAALGATWIFLFEAYEQIGVGVSTLFYYCGPIIVMALSPFLFSEKLTAVKAAGFIAVLAGMVFVNGLSLESGGFTFGTLCGVMSGVGYAVMFILNKKASSITGLENSMYQMIASFATVAVFTMAKQGLTFGPVSDCLIPVLILGLVNTGVGNYLYFSSFQKLPVATASVCGYLEPLSAVLFSALLLGETMSGMQILGAALIIGGAVFAETAPLLQKTLSAKSGLARNSFAKSRLTKDSPEKNSLTNSALGETE